MVDVGTGDFTSECGTGEAGTEILVLLLLSRF